MSRIKYILFAAVFFLALAQAWNRQKYTSTVGVVDGYATGAIHPGELLFLSVNATKPHKQANLRIFDLHGNTVDSVIAKVKIENGNGRALWKNGFGYETSPIKIPALRSGVYLIEQRIPLVVGDKKKHRFTIVYPFVNFNCSSPEGGKSFYSYNSTGNEAADTLSLHRPQELPASTRLLLKAVDSLFQESYNVIRDSDLKNITTTNYKTLIFFENFSFVTKEAYSMLLDFAKNGGNVVFITSSPFLNEIEINEKQSQVVLKGARKSNVLLTDFGFYPEEACDTTWAKPSNKCAGNTTCSLFPTPYINTTLETSGGKFESIMHYYCEGKPAKPMVTVMRRGKGLVINFGTSAWTSSSENLSAFSEVMQSIISCYSL